MYKPIKNHPDTSAGLVIVKTRNMWVFLKKLKPAASCVWVWVWVWV